MCNVKRMEVFIMCSECLAFPHLPGCPNAPEPEPELACSECGEGIFAGDEFFDGINGPICSECLNDKTVAEMLEIFGERLSIA